MICIFIPAVYEDSIPHSRAEDTGEERRLPYVAMTRAQALLYLSVPRSQSRDSTETTISQFLPSALGRHFSELSPSFNKQVIADMASILRRPEPSQKQLVVSLQSMSITDSINDDLWACRWVGRTKEISGQRRRRARSFGLDIP